MTDVFTKLSLYLQYPFVRYALAAGVLIALSASILGVTLVLKRYSFIGDGLSHVAFGAMAIASVLNLVSDMAVVLPVTILSAVLLLRGGKNKKTKGDADIAMLSVGTLAIGYLIMSIFSTSPNVSGDVCSTLFGSSSILTLSKEDVWLCAIMSGIVLLVFALLYNKIFLVTFDENFARGTGTHADFYNTIIAIITAVIIVLAMNLAGSLLTSALIVFPAVSAMRISKSFKSVIIVSGIFSVVCTFLGMIISILISAPVGPMIVAVDIIGYLTFILISKIKKL